MPRTLFVGHSLVNTTMPFILDRLLTNRQVDYQVINGASLDYNWRHSWDAEGVSARQVLPSGRYDNVILTEQIPTSGSLRAHFAAANTNANALKFARLAWDADPDARIMVYETWTYMPSGSLANWRKSLSSNHAVWEGVANYLSNHRPDGAPEALVVPVGLAMARLYDAIQAGRGAGFDSIRDLFSDNIHYHSGYDSRATANGSYYVALVQYAAIEGSSPVGLPTMVQRPHNSGPYSGWTPLQATLMQHVAWETVAASDVPLDSGTVRPVVRVGSTANNTLNGGNGDDRAYGGGGSDTIRGHDGRDLIVGGDRGDELQGGNGNDWLLGDGGNDSIFGGYGNDRIFGGKGNDRLAGGGGNDTLTGGDGADRFVFANNGNADRVEDFDLGDGDRLVFSDDLWSGTRTAQQLVNAATVTSAGVVFDFGGGDTLTLAGLHSKAGLAAVIDII